MATATVLCRCQKLLTSSRDAPTDWFSHPVVYLLFEIERMSRQFGTFNFRLVTCTDKVRVFYLHLQCCKSTLYIQHICEDAYLRLQYPPSMQQSSHERRNFPHFRLRSPFCQARLQTLSLPPRNCHSCRPQPPFHARLPTHHLHMYVREFLFAPSTD